MERVDSIVQYGDLKGTCACDGHMGSPLHKIAEMINLSKNYFPIAISVDIIELGKAHIKLFACDKNIYGSSFNEIKKKIRENKVNVKGFDVEMPIGDLLKTAKRFSMALKDRGFTECEMNYSE